MKYFSAILIFLFLTSCAVFEADVSPKKGATFKPVNNQAKSKSPDSKNGIAVKKTAKKNIKGVTKEGFTIQVGAFKNVKNAGVVVDELNSRGLDAFLYKDDKIYKVRFGNYKSYDEAKTVAVGLMNKNTISDYYVVRPEEFATYTSEEHGGDEEYLRSQLVKTANQYIGIPYQWGGNSAKSGFDCSGLTRAVYRLNGMSIPRVSVDQFSSGENIKIKELKKGDLVFFATSGSKVNHVGIYIGDDRFIHAPSRGKTVRFDDITNSYWKNRFKGARTYL